MKLSEEKSLLFLPAGFLAPGATRWRQQTFLLGAHLKRPYFAFFPGDYLADTIGLSCCEHGIYMLLLAVSWQRGPLPDDMDHLSRLAANPPIEALRYILENYWTQTEQGWINKRLEKEKEYAEEAHQRRVEAGKKGGVKKSSNAKAMLKQSSSTHTHTHTHTHTQRGANAPRQRKIPKESVAEVFAHWHKRTGRDARTKLTKTREAKIRARLEDGYSVADLKTAIDGNLASPWHQGKNENGIVYDSIDLIFRNADKVEMFLSRTKEAEAQQRSREDFLNGDGESRTIEGTARRID